jgi:hypothetical protein
VTRAYAARADHERVRALLLLVLKSLSVGAFIAFIAGWVVGFLIHPSPHWLFSVMFAVGGVGMASALLYHVANQSFTDPIEDVHWEIETPTTVGNLLRQNWAGPLFLWIAFSVVSFAILRDHFRTAAAVPLGLIVGTAVCWAFIFAHARGWVRDE